MKNKRNILCAGLLVLFFVMAPTGSSSFLRAQTQDDQSISSEVSVSEGQSVTRSDSEEAMVKEPTFHQIIKTKFIEGGAGFMGIVLLALILGLALCIERILYLYFAETNPKRIITSVEKAIEEGGFDKAKEVCRDTRGPIASIFYQGFDRVDQGIEVVEKAVVSYGGVQMGLLERNISWISLFIALAPMLGFMGTVIGMISAFDSIEAAGDISPTLVAKGIKQALLTTVFGLIVAIILQIFYNYIISKVEKIVNEMEDASISLIDIIIKHRD